MRDGNRFTKLGSLLVLVTAMAACVPRPASADITCYDFTGKTEAQAVLDALPNDPFGLDSGCPPPDSLGGGDREAGNGLACDAETDIHELESPGNEEYRIGDNPRLMGLPIPEYESYAEYEEDEVPGQCGGEAATERLQELLAPSTNVWLEVDEAGFYTRYQLDRHIWIELDGRYRLVSEILVSEGHEDCTVANPTPEQLEGYRKLADDIIAKLEDAGWTMTGDEQ